MAIIENAVAMNIDTSIGMIIDIIITDTSIGMTTDTTGAVTADAVSAAEDNAYTCYCNSINHTNCVNNQSYEKTFDCFRRAVDTSRHSLV